MDKLITNILTAPVYDVAQITPLEALQNLSNAYHNQIYAKREDLQGVFSFKCRGAYNKLARLLQNDPARAKKGVITASAGNHAQGVALAAKKLGLHATIVMPNITPEIKINAVRRLGGEAVNVVIFGDNFDAAAAHAKQLQQQADLTFIHPFDDLDVIAGQGTVGKEIIEQLHDVNAIFIPIGGGGLIAGVAAYVKTLKPEVKIIGVEHIESASMQQAITNKQIITLEHVGIFADGIAVKRVGEHTFPLVQQYVDEIITVSTDEICAAIKNIFDETRSIVEPSGAAALAGVKAYLQQHPSKNQNLVAILTGANMNFDRLRHVTERMAIGAQKECLLGVKIPETPGAFEALCEVISQRAVTEFNYRYAGNNAKDAHIFIGIAIANGREEINAIIQRLEQAGYPVADFSDNDTAKLHMRYLIGGRNQDKPELLFRFEFPERPGALLNFLHHIRGQNITLFHYRNHGSDYGRVLVGIETPADKNALLKQLDKLGYYYADESQNPAYQMFL